MRTARTVSLTSTSLLPVLCCVCVPLVSRKIPNPDDEKVVVFSLEFPDPAPLRQPVVANVKEMSFKYDVTKAGVKREEVGEDGGWLLENVTVNVDMHSRIGILGPNGCGQHSARTTRFRLFHRPLHCLTQSSH